MNLIRLAVAQPITVSVGIILSLLAGIVALVRVPIQMTPEVESVVIAVTTTWEGASALEIETDVIEQQEARLGNLSGLVQMTSTSQAGQGQVRLEFRTGTRIADARSEVDQRLAEVPGYPEGVNQPTVVDADPESVDYITWIGLSSSDPDFDPTTLRDFSFKRILPRFERLPGVAEVGLVGVRERELQVLVDPARLADRGVTYAELVQTLRVENGNWSAGKLSEGKNDVRVRAVGRFSDPLQVEALVLRRTAAGSVLLRDVAEVRIGLKERTNWARARGHFMPFFNMQLESGANLLETIGAVDVELAALNADGGLLQLEAKRLGVNGDLRLVKTYDSTTYVKDALALVRSNIVIGGGLAMLVLFLFLRSMRTVGIVGVAIPISVIVAVIVLVGLGRSVNIVSLAGMAFAVGMVVDNAIVVIENIFRHLEMRKGVRQACIEGTEEVGGAVLASTLTTVIVFLPILLIQDSAGQLFRDIALAIVASVGISLIVSLTVIPSASAALLSERLAERLAARERARSEQRTGRPRGRFARGRAFVVDIPARAAATFRWLTQSALRGVITVVAFAVITLLGIFWLTPPLDYLPTGNRNISFGILFPPPAYNLDQLSEIGERIEKRVRPFWEAAGDRFAIESVTRGERPLGPDARTAIPTPKHGAIVPPPVDQYFLVGVNGQMFHGAISLDPQRAADTTALLQWAAGPGVAPDVFSFALQLPIFRTGGTTGSAISIDLTARELDQIVPAAGALLGALMGEYGPGATRPDPSNFNLPSPELRFTPIDERLRQAGLTRQDLGFAVQANGDGLLVPRQFELEGELKDLKLLSPKALGDDPIPALLSTPLATPNGGVVDIGSLAHIERVTGPDKIKRVDRQRAITLQLTPPAGQPLEAVLDGVERLVGELRQSGAISDDVEVRYKGSAGKLADIKAALVGDGTFVGLLSSSLFLALVVVYLMMVVLFQS